MPVVESKLAVLGLVLPAPMQALPGLVLPFSMLRIVGTRALVSGHAPQNPNGSFAQPLGKVGRAMTPEQGHVAARLATLSIFGCHPPISTRQARCRLPGPWH